MPHIILPYSSGSSGGGSPATVAATVAALGTGSDGKLGVIRVGSGTDIEYVELVYDATNSRWVSKAESLLAMSDLGYMASGAVTGGGTTVYDYIDTFASGGADAIGWTTRPVRKAYDLLLAGLTLQICLTAFVQPASGNVVATFNARFFANADGDTITFSADGSTAKGEMSTPLATPATSGSVYYKSSSWQNVNKISTANALLAADVGSGTPHLWPRLYMKVASGTNNGQIIDADLQCRWVA